LIGTTESLALTPEDLHAFHAAASRPGTSTLVVVGDLAPDQVLPLLETHFGKWQPPGLNRVAEPAPAPAGRAPALLVDMPGAPQSRILVGGVGGPNSCRLLSDPGPDHHRRGQIERRPERDAARLHGRRAIGLRQARTSATPFVVSAAAQVEDRRVAQSVGRRGWGTW
jgi:hypothetical protein